MFGPVSGGYPGKYVCFGFVVFLAGLYGVVWQRSFKLRKPPGLHSSITFSKDSLKDPSLSQVIGFGIVFSFLIGMTLWNIYVHRPY